MILIFSTPLSAPGVEHPRRTEEEDPCLASRAAWAVVGVIFPALISLLRSVTGWRPVKPPALPELTAFPQQSHVACAISSRDIAAVERHTLGRPRRLPPFLWPM